MVERPASAFCDSAEEWPSAPRSSASCLPSWRGVVLFPEVGLPDRMFLAPQTCEPANEFLQAPTREAQKARQARVPRRGRSATRSSCGGTAVGCVKRTRRVVVQVPVYEACETYHQRIYAVATAAHEAMQRLGVGDEAAAECSRSRW